MANGVQDLGIEFIGSYIRGEVPTSIGSCAFGMNDDAFTGSSTHLGSEIIRVPLTWSVVGSSVLGQAILSTTQANGSYITELGLVQGASDAGSDIFSADLSAIGSKNSTFSTIVEQRVTIRKEF